MDFLHHALTGVTIAKAMRDTDPIASAVSAMLPDIAGIMPFYYFKLIEATKNPNNSFTGTLYNLLISNKFSNAIDKASYRTTHSIITALIFAGVAYIIYREHWVSMSLSYLSHILVDIPTHQGQFATRILYPISDVHYARGGNWAVHRNKFLFFWVLLGVAMFLVWQTH